MSKLLDITEKLIKLLIEHTPIDYILGDLTNDEPWNGLNRYYG